MKAERITESILIELLEYAKSKKISSIEYEGNKYNIKDYKFKKYYTIYDKNDFYISECSSLDELQEFLQVAKKRSISIMIAQHNLIKDKYYIYPTYELAI